MPTLTNPLYQSPYLYMQSAGSTGLDGSVRGMHLRWALRGRLGERHLPKGDLTTQAPFATAQGFNRQKDFVRIYRAEYKARHPLQWNSGSPPTTVNENGAERVWTYFVQSGQISGTIRARFLDVAAYDALRAAQPQLNRPDFMRTYPGALEVGVVDRLCFEIRAVEFSFLDRIRAVIKAEVFTRSDNGDPASDYLSRRHVFRLKHGDAHFKEPVELLCENMPFVRFQLSDVRVHTWEFSTYDHLIERYEMRGNWMQVGDFALTLDDAEAMTRLENTPIWQINKQWPKFNGQLPGSDAFTVKLDNYRDRWKPADPIDGLKEGVNKYLRLSRFDPAAIEVVSDEDGQSNSEISYLQMLRVVSVDFHIARMLGLGHIEAMTEKVKELRWVYLAEYITEAKLEEDGPAGLRTHYFMGLPTRQSNFRLPPRAPFKPLEYGLFIDNGTQTPMRISDAQGYVPVENGPHDYVRYVNLKRDRFRYEEPPLPFFAETDEFSICELSLPVTLGVEYAADNEVTYRQPEILQDDVYDDPAGFPEVAPILDSGDLHRPLYTHRETEEGVHRYALYAVNWFSRCSSLSTAQATDATSFPVRNSLRPPSNLAVQLIQEEEPRLFTTADEQVRRTNLPGPDRTLVRATFDWNHMHIDEYQFADTVEFFFREAPPLTVQGRVASVAELSGNRAHVSTDDLVITSVQPNRTLRPTVAAANAARFVGSLLMADQVPYEVLSVTPGSHAQFIVKKYRSTEATDTDGDGTYQVTESFSAPAPGTQFIVYENLSDPGSWDFRLTSTVALQNFLPTLTETVTHPDGTQRVFTLGGLLEQADIAELPDRFAPDAPAVLADSAAAPFPGDPIPNSHTGVFTLTFTGVNLTQHPQADVDWYKGSVRIAEDDSSFPPSGSPSYRAPVTKVLQIADIADLSPLQLIVMDPEFDPDSNQTDPSEEYIPIKTGAGVDVNIHPAYRCYLIADTAGSNSFDAATLLPATGAGRKITFMAARSADTTQTPPLVSALSAPAPLLAMELVEPVAPEVPTGPLYATRPDFYGKATYTFDVEVNTAGGRLPYALVFYRANERQLLDALYRPQTVAQILTDLAGLPEADAAFANHRWADLANLQIDGATDRFKTYVPGGYRFPLPDNADYVIPNADPTLVDKPFNGQRDFGDLLTVRLGRDPNGQIQNAQVPMTTLVRDALQGVFLPLTEQPVLYKYIKPARQTSRAKPKIRDANGQMIFPSSPIDFDVFDPFPMVVRFSESGATKVRFTDYTLDGASSAMSFYFAVELSNRMTVSDASPVSGPIQMVNAMPAEKPSIKTITSLAENPLSASPAGVRVTVEPVIAAENIRKFSLYRATRPEDAVSTRSMALAGTFDADAELLDTFNDLAVPPYAEPLFYRVVALREIVNERDEVEYVPSQPSDPALTSVIDNFAPPAPVLRFVSDPRGGSPVVLGNVRLQWDKTVHNGRYTLYKRNPSGNWSMMTSLEDNDATLEVRLQDTEWNAADLPKENADGDPVFHHFKVTATNASGLVSREENILTI